MSLARRLDSFRSGLPPSPGWVRGHAPVHAPRAGPVPGALTQARAVALAHARTPAHSALAGGPSTARLEPLEHSRLIRRDRAAAQLLLFARCPNSRAVNWRSQPSSASVREPRQCRARPEAREVPQTPVCGDEGVNVGAFGARKRARNIGTSFTMGINLSAPQYVCSTNS
jgi:hypothetical protein